MKGLRVDGRSYWFHVVVDNEPISRNLPRLPTDDEYHKIIAEGKAIYTHRAPFWCSLGRVTRDEAASLLSGILPRNDDLGKIFWQKYRSDNGTVLIGEHEYPDLSFRIFTDNFDCLMDVREILSRSSMGEEAHPREWAIFANAEGLLPNKIRPHIDNSPLLSLLEPVSGIVSDSLSPPQSTPNIANPWLMLQIAALNRFYNPRLDPDVKKVEVVEWLKSEGERMGLQVSHNKASVMFGMIKAQDHNPKTKRVKPQ